MNLRIIKVLVASNVKSIAFTLLSLFKKSFGSTQGGHILLGTANAHEHRERNYISLLLASATSAPDTYEDLRHL